MKVLGMGNALVDILVQINNEHILDKHSLPKGSMQLVDFEKANAVITDTFQFPSNKASGGSAANTINGLSKLGLQTAFLGKIGDDEMGQFFHNDLLNNNIESKLLKGINKSGMAVALVTPDAERTFATYLGAAIELTPSDLSKELFNGYDIFYIEGYLVQNQQLIETAITLAKSAGCKVCLDLAAYNVVEANIDFLKKMATEVDIVFANEEEAKALTGMEPVDALHQIAKDVEIAVVKLGKNGSMVKTGGQVFEAGVIKANSVDTTGAGDLFAAGFLYGMSKNYNFDHCARIGAIVAGNVIEVIGAKMDETRWNSIREAINQLS